MASWNSPSRIPRGAKEAPPVRTVQLFPDLLDELLRLLAALSPDEWTRPVPRKSWSVHDVALHLLGGDVGVLSRRRDGFTASTVTARSRAELVRGLAAFNEAWVGAGQRISPRLLRDLLRFTGEQVIEYFTSLDPDAEGEVVSWAGPAPAPNWLNIGQEYTERWHHQQHIREALGRPGFDDVTYLRPALEIFMRALPETYRRVAAPDGTVVAVTIVGGSGSRWLLVRGQESWVLYEGRCHTTDASVVIPQETAWKLFTRWMSKEQVLSQVQVDGDPTLAQRALEMTAVIA